MRCKKCNRSLLFRSQENPKSGKPEGLLFHRKGEGEACRASAERQKQRERDQMYRDYAYPDGRMERRYLDGRRAALPRAA